MTRVGLLTLVIALGLSAAWSTAHAEQGEQGRSLFARLAPRPDELERERTAELERRLARLLATWPGVRSAEVQLTLPLAAEQPLDRPLPPPRVAVVLTRTTAQPQAEVVLKLLQSALPTLTLRDLTVLDHSETAEPPSPPRASASATAVSVLRVGLATSLAVNALLAAIVLLRLRGHRPAAQKVDPQARLSSPP